MAIGQAEINVKGSNPTVFVFFGKAAKAFHP
jgi:hypothetical protein